MVSFERDSSTSIEKIVIKRILTITELNEREKIGTLVPKFKSLNLGLNEKYINQNKS